MTRHQTLIEEQANWLTSISLCVRLAVRLGLFRRRDRTLRNTSDLATPTYVRGRELVN